MEETKAAIRARQQPPTFKTQLSDVQAKENDTEAQFKCTVSGIPRPEIACYHNETRLTLSRFVRVVYVDDRLSVTLCDLTLDMAGQYSVKATNAAGEATTSACLEITELSEEERSEIRKKKEVLLLKRKQREEERIARIEEKKRLQEEAARKMMEKRECLKAMRFKKIQKDKPAAPDERDSSKKKTTITSKTEQTEIIRTGTVEIRRKISSLEAYTIEEIRVNMDVEEIQQFMEERQRAERRLSSLEAPLVEEISPSVVAEQLKMITAEKLVAETKLTLLETYTVHELNPQTSTTEMKTFIEERESARGVWHQVEQMPQAEPLQEHIVKEVWQLELDKSVAAHRLRLADQFVVQELRPDLSADDLETFIVERREARRRVSTCVSIDVTEVTAAEVVRDLARILSVEEVSAQMKLDLRRAYSVQHVTTESTVHDTKTFLTERHQVQQMLTTALLSAENTEVCPLYVAAEVEHISGEKAAAISHLQLVEPTAVAEMETMLQTTLPLKHFKDFDYDYYFGAITVHFTIYLPAEGSHGDFIIEPTNNK